MHYLVISGFFEQFAHFDRLFAADLLDAGAGVVAQAAGDGGAGGAFDGDQVAALEGAFDFGDAGREQAFVFLDHGFDRAVVDDDGADGPGGADPAAAAGALAGGGDEERADFDAGENFSKNAGFAAVGDDHGLAAFTHGFGGGQLGIHAALTGVAALSADQAPGFF